METTELEAKIRELEIAKNGAYSERNKLVALLSKLFPASLEPHQHVEGQDWEPEWLWVVFIQLPTGQISFHIHNSELPMYNHLHRNTGVKWDGHENDIKWLRIATFMPDVIRKSAVFEIGCDS